MTYTFIGFLSEATVSEINSLNMNYDVRSYDVPKRMTAVRIQDNPDGIKTRVLIISKLLPHRRFIALYYSTFGGSIEFCGGLACVNGTTIAGTDVSGEYEDGEVAFKELLKGMEIILPSSGYFRPFEKSPKDL